MASRDDGWVVFLDGKLGWTLERVGYSGKALDRQCQTRQIMDRDVGVCSSSTALYCTARRRIGTHARTPLETPGSRCFSLSAERTQDHIRLRETVHDRQPAATTTLGTA